VCGLSGVTRLSEARGSLHAVGGAAAVRVWVSKAVRMRRRRRRREVWCRVRTTGTASEGKRGNMGCEGQTRAAMFKWEGRCHDVEWGNRKCSYGVICCQTCPYQTCPFQHYYQLSSGEGFRSSLQPFRTPNDV
jgi:hypothetical protein